MENPLLQYRNKKNVSLTDAAKLCGVHASTFLRWERGEINVSTQNLDKVAQVTGVPRVKLRCLTMLEQ